ncbi:MAG: hypothetical protein M1281_20085 [Chloroflexi bacterium]|nr:hypothetical protein [Chloroflexota bacterium]
MNRLMYLVLLVLIAVTLSSCEQSGPTQTPPPTTTPIPPPAAQASASSTPISAGKIKPGDTIGEMIVAQGSPTLPYPYLWQFCEYMPNEFSPIASTTDCNAPLMSGLSIVFGWIAKESNFLPNWEAMTWELWIDERKIDLEAFDWFESDYVSKGKNNKERRWIIDLKIASPGMHSLKLSWNSGLAVDDGFNTYQPGTYQHVVNFTILEKAVYPGLSSTANVGLHSYTSGKAKLDFLLYLPGAYGKDPQKEWPLMVYLHGAHLRGATLDLLKNEPLPRYVQEQSEFPFILVSPLGDGEFEFWAKDKMINPLFTLLDEIQSTYSIDSQRIYLTGNDMGGNGVWAISLRYPKYFAALAPISGYFGYPFEVPKNICDLKDVPTWVFHGDRDPYIPLEVAQNLVDALVACGGNAQLTVSPRMVNDVAYNVYATPELYDWLLQQERK